MMKNDKNKGSKAEEAMRSYFRSLGYFAVRAVPFAYRGHDVTDLDIWLYKKSSAASRETACVDIKNKKTPQAIERIFWVTGVQHILGLDQAIVATTDKREETKAFGEKHGVIVFDGTFQQRAQKEYAHIEERMTEEKMFSTFGCRSVQNPKTTLAQYFLEMKGGLIGGLDFNRVNTFLEHIRFLVLEFQATNMESDAVLRILYAAISYFLVALDYVSRSLFQLDANSCEQRLTDGFRFGNAGEQRARELVEMAARLVSATPQANLFTNDSLTQEVDTQLSEYRAEVLAQHFSRPEIIEVLFELGLKFEVSAYSTELVSPQSLPSMQKGLIGVLCDFFQISRKELI